MIITGSNQGSTRLLGKLKDPLCILTIATTIIAIALSTVQIIIGVNYFDVFTHLNVALQYSGLVTEGANMVPVPPLIPFLTSLVFRAGLVSSSVIIILNAIFFIIGVIGLYLLFKHRFNEIQSFTACLIYISLPMVFSWAASGSTDVPAISLSIWTMYFMVRGVEKDPKYLYLVIPMLALAILSRYTTAILVIPLLFYFIVGTNFLKTFRTHVKQIIIPLAIIIPFLVYAYFKISYFSCLIFLTIQPLVFGKVFGVGDAAYNPDNFYYLNNLLNYLAVGPVKGNYYEILSPSLGSASIFAFIIAILVILGLGIYVYTILEKKYRVSKNKYQEMGGIGKWSMVQLLFLGFLVIAGIFSFYEAPYLVTNIIVLCICLLIYNLLGDVDGKNLKMDLLFLLWFFTFFIMHSVTPVKVDRYMITIAPAMAYFTFLGLSVLIERYKSRIKKDSIRSGGLYLMVGLVFLTSTTVTFAGHTPNTCLIKYVEPTAQWLEDYDPQYQDKVIFSDYSPAVSWSMKKMVFTGVLRDYNNVDEFSSMLIESNAEYYIDVFSENKPALQGYQAVNKTDQITVYQKIH